VLSGQECVLDGYGSVLVVGSTVLEGGIVVVVGAMVVVGAIEKKRQRHDGRYNGRSMTISSLPAAAASAVLRWRR
jgi:hypothetical protein